MSKNQMTHKKALAAVRRAAIYIRVSSERQAEKVSPQIQEDDCRRHCEDRGYQVVAVYRDTEKYRAGDKIVEPSGTRSDRPGLKQMLADAATDKFDVIVAWKEDRLYRSYRPMLDVLECIEQHKLDIELAKESFDKRMMGGKVWVAKMELDSIQERMTLGRKGRVKKGKMLGHMAILGYDIIDGQATINEREAETVRFIFDQVAWGDRDHPAGIPIKELRRRLVDRGDKQKTDKPKTIPWARGVVYSILHCKTYLGEMTYKVDGQTFTIQVPAIIDQETWVHL